MFFLPDCGNCTSTGTPALRSFTYVDVGEPTRHPCSITGMMQDNHLLQLGVTGDIYLRELLCHREEALSGMRIFFSESVVFHLVFWVSSLLCCFGLCLCLGLLCFDFRRHLAFCFSPVLEQRENSCPKTKRFDDRQSLERARHEQKKKSRFTALKCPIKGPTSCTGTNYILLLFAACTLALAQVLPTGFHQSHRPFLHFWANLWMVPSLHNCLQCVDYCCLTKMALLHVFVIRV